MSKLIELSNEPGSPYHYCLPSFLSLPRSVSLASSLGPFAQFGCWLEPPAARASLEIEPNPLPDKPKRARGWRTPRQYKWVNYLEGKRKRAIEPSRKWLASWLHLANSHQEAPGSLDRVYTKRGYEWIDIKLKLKPTLTKPRDDLSLNWPLKFSCFGPHAWQPCASPQWTPCPFSKPKPKTNQTKPNQTE